MKNRGKAVALLLPFFMTSVQANAQWYARNDNADNLVVTAVMKDQDELTLVSYLTCEDKRLTWTFETNSITTDLSDYKPTSIAINVPRSEPIYSLDLAAEPILMPSGTISFQGRMNTSETKTFLNTLGQGRKIHVKIDGEQLSTDDIQVTISALFSSLTAPLLKKSCDIDKL
ncbi:hypothetical protein ABE527_14300 [Brucella sp. TWI432]